MKTFNYIVCLISIILCYCVCSCSTDKEEESFDNKTPIAKSAEREELENGDNGTNLRSSYAEYINNHPELFGQKYMYFSSENEMDSMLNVITELNWSDLKLWSITNGIDNSVIAANVAYDSVLSRVEDEYNFSFVDDGVPPAMFYNVFASIVNHLGDISEFVAVEDSNGFYTYKPIEPMSEKVFTNNKNLFIIDNMIYKFYRDGEIVIELDTSINNFPNLIQQANYSINLEDFLDRLQNMYAIYYASISPNYNGDPRYIHKCYTNGNYQIILNIETDERPVIFHQCSRKTYVSIGNYLKTNHERVAIRAKTNLYISVETYNYGDLNSITHIFNRLESFKEKTFTRSTCLHDDPHFSYIRLSSLSYDISNIYGVEAAL